jgi:tRNA(adenine34) deaminase
MWNHLSVPWQAALEMAWEAYCDGCIPIGAVVTDAEGQILSRGRNRIYEGRTPDWTKPGAELRHAEIDALFALDYSVGDPHQWVLYTTTEPCPMCLGTFYMSGIRSLHYASRDPWAGSTDLLGKTFYLSRKPVRVFGPPDPVLELALMSLYIERVCEFRGVDSIFGALYERWQEVVPQCLAVGKMLFETGLVAGLRAEKASAQEMVNCLADRIQL